MPKVPSGLMTDRRSRPEKNIAITSNHSPEGWPQTQLIIDHGRIFEFGIAADPET
jgi:hypothetical protein